VWTTLVFRSTGSLHQFKGKIRMDADGPADVPPARDTGRHRSSSFNAISLCHPSFSGKAEAQDSSDDFLRSHNPVLGVPLTTALHGVSRSRLPPFVRPRLLAQCSYSWGDPTPTPAGPRFFSESKKWTLISHVKRKYIRWNLCLLKKISHILLQVACFLKLFSKGPKLFFW
jgi:hypothetical protein